MQLQWPARYSEIPKEVFHREDIYRRELERIFYGPEWHPVAHLSEVPKPGDFKTTYVGEAPLLILHGDDGQVRVFLNSCPHRGTQLQTCSRGNGKGITCPYHRWAFDNNGALLAAPGSERFPENFRKQDYGLRAVRFEMLHGLILASLSPDAPPLEKYLGDGVEYLRKLLGGDGRLTLLGYQKVVYSTNWKEYGDNEGYHAPLLHRAFRLLQWQGGDGTQCVTEYGHKLIEAELRASRNASFLDDDSLVEFRDRSAPPRSIIVNLFPMSTMTKHMDVINLRYSFPRSPHETEVHYAYFAHQDDDAEMFRHRLRQASNLLGPSGLISLEDGAVFNRLHEGSRTPGGVVFQKGVKGRLAAPCFVEQNDEASNLVKWERYRTIMGFERDRS
jgi:phenylpropionate dioxygenase-like ring-hydroxylating dioxygenase large terminal subunit